MRERRPGRRNRFTGWARRNEICSAFPEKFQKKSPSGIRTARTDVALVAKRLKDAIQDHEERYGKEKS